MKPNFQSPLNSLFPVLLLFVALLFSAEGIQAQTADKAQAQVQAKAPLTYKVQVGAFKDPTQVNLLDLATIGSIYVEDVNAGGLQRVVLGYYSDRAMAERVLTQVKDLGYEKAFVNHHQEAAAEPMSLKDGDLMRPAEMNMSDRTATSTDAAATGHFYLIDLGAYNEVAHMPNAKQLTKSGDTFTRQHATGRLQLLLGKYADPQQAKMALGEATKAGFKEAQIVLLTEEELTAIVLPDANVPSNARNFKDASKTVTIEKESTELAPTKVSDQTKATSTSQAKASETLMSDASKKTPAIDQAALYPPPSSKAQKPQVHNAGAQAQAKAKAQAKPLEMSDRPTVLDDVPSTAPVEVGPAKQLVNDIESLNKLFPYKRVDKLTVKVYDPTQERNTATKTTKQAEKDANAKFKGAPIPGKLHYFFKKPYSMPTYAIARFDLDPRFVAYMVRTGDSTFENSATSLHIFDRQGFTFVDHQPLAFISKDGNAYRTTETIIMDMDGNRSLDLLSYFTEEGNAANGQYFKKTDVSSKVWSDRFYVPANMSNKDQVLLNLGLATSK